MLILIEIFLIIIWLGIYNYPILKEIRNAEEKIYKKEIDKAKKEIEVK